MDMDQQLVRVGTGGVGRCGVAGRAGRAGEALRDERGNNLASRAQELQRLQREVQQLQREVERLQRENEKLDDKLEGMGEVLSDYECENERLCTALCAALKGEYDERKHGPKGNPVQCSELLAMYEEKLALERAQEMDKSGEESST